MHESIRKNNGDGRMILVIRISGKINISFKIQETLNRILLRRKYSAVLLQNTKQNIDILKNLRNYVAYGPINDATLKLLIEKRAVLKNKDSKLDVEKIINQIEKKSKSSWDIKPFFRLHPPLKGIDAKKHFGVTKKAVLADNGEKINDLVRR